MTTTNDLLSHLEPGQLVESSIQPLHRACLSRQAQRALWALRILTFALAAMVITTFVLQLG